MKLTIALLFLAGSLFAGDPVTLTLKDFTSANGGGPGEGWAEKDGVIALTGKGAGILLSKDEYASFELEWDWKLAEGGNNGIKYWVTKVGGKEWLGIEYQMIDDKDGHDYGAKHSTASFYDVLPPTVPNAAKPAGEWNHSRVLVQGNHVEHWLNGKNVLEYELGSEEVLKAVQKSKFKSVEGFGKNQNGHILLTYHNGPVSYRNIKIRPLAGAK